MSTNKLIKEKKGTAFFTFQKCPLSPLRLFRGLLFLKYPPSSPELNVYNTLATPGEEVNTEIEHVFGQFDCNVD